MNDEKIIANVTQWFKEHGESLKGAMGCFGPDDVFVAAIVKMIDAFLMAGNPEWESFPCDQTLKAKEVIGPFISGRAPIDLDALRVAFVIQNMNLERNAEIMHCLRERTNKDKLPMRHLPKRDPRTIKKGG